MTLRERIKRHEGKRHSPYLDSEGFLTVGYGRNLDAVPFTDRELEVMLDTDISRARINAQKFDVFPLLNAARQEVLIEMCFQMGYAGVAKFKRFLAAAADQQWEDASREMLDSKWAKQTPSRAKELAETFRNG